MKNSIAIGMIFGCLIPSEAQVATDSSYLQMLPQAWPIETNHFRWGKEFYNVRNELDALFTGLFVAYKAFLSSQDGGRCVFEPSCSVYGLRSIRKLGLIRGLLNTFDRLTRCHPQLGGDFYPIDPQTGRLYDPI